MKPKITWRVQPEETGPYRSFHKRGWPVAHYTLENGDTTPCAMIICEDEYLPARAKEGDHAPLEVCVADYTVPEGRWKWRKLKRPAATLKEAKERVAAFIEKNPDWVPEFAK